MTYRAAALKFRPPKFTIWDHASGIRGKAERKSGKALTTSEGQLIVNLALRYSDKGIPLSRKHIIEAASILVSTFTDEPKSKLRFASGRPGAKWVREFMRRHSEVLKVSVFSAKTSRHSQIQLY